MYRPPERDDDDWEGDDGDWEMNDDNWGPEWCGDQCHGHDRAASAAPTARGRVRHGRTHGAREAEQPAGAGGQRWDTPRVPPSDKTVTAHGRITLNKI